MRIAHALSILAATAVLARTGTARASADTFGVGDGHSGALTVTATNTIVNTYTSLTVGAGQGDGSLTVVSSVGYSAGDLVLVWQTYGVNPAPASGSQTAVDLSSSAVGRWELARVTGVPSATRLDLSAGLLFAYDAATSQVVRVPEYTTVAINAGASLAAKPWDGLSGGILVFLATGAVTNAGAITADGTGGRSGAYVNGVAAVGCTLVDDTPPQGAQKGEGVGFNSYGVSKVGRGNIANGAGGGVCSQSGGAGGGNGGQGGKGGRSSDQSRDVGGLGGAKLTYSLLDRLAHGGGGGAGQGQNAAGTSGAPGGGVILIRARTLAGGGTISSRGMAASNGGNDGQGGGGAGGSAYLRFIQSATCGGVDVSGGAGGSSSAARVGPGGGGAGGRALLQAASGGSCNVTVGCGLSGTQTDGTATDGLRHGATPATASEASCSGIVEAPPIGGGFCLSNGDCQAPTPFCDAPKGTCVECLSNTDCPTQKPFCLQPQKVCSSSADGGAGDGGSGGDGGAGGDGGPTGDGGGSADGAAGDGSAGAGGAIDDGTFVAGGGCDCNLQGSQAPAGLGLGLGSIALGLLLRRRKHASR